MELISNGHLVDSDLLDSVDELKDNPLVKEAVSKARNYLHGYGKEVMRKKEAMKLVKKMAAMQEEQEMELEMER